ncbi:hypothetical protein B0H14DRAFT_117093 [Mycena olivaceomarginata]|nr:hypothetical protein B0H14DRAFT_117093 [Mycena olivaceomarginata]
MPPRRIFLRRLTQPTHHYRLRAHPIRIRGRGDVDDRSLLSRYTAVTVIPHPRSWPLRRRRWECRDANTPCPLSSRQGPKLGAHLLLYTRPVLRITRRARPAPFRRTSESSIVAECWRGRGGVGRGLPSAFGFTVVSLWGRPTALYVPTVGVSSSAWTRTRPWGEPLRIGGSALRFPSRGKHSRHCRHDSWRLHSPSAVDVSRLFRPVPDPNTLGA